MGEAAPRRDGEVVQRVVDSPGFVEPHTPGSGAPEEMPAGAKLEALLGAPVDLNRVTTVRTRFEGASRRRPKAVLILIPGFLGGATTLDPIARDLVAAFRGELEVWAVDRRPNQLEDRLGSMHASEHANEPECRARPPAPGCAIFEGAQFYFPDLDRPPLGVFPSRRDLDIDMDGVFDPQLPLTDRFGVERGPILMTQDDVRFFAYWGLDTYFRDWKRLVAEARRLVTPAGVVLLGGHSQGTTWATLFAAYDFDPDPGRVDAGYSLIDGLVLLEGGGARSGTANLPHAQYQQRVAALATSGGPDVFLTDLIVIPLLGLAQVGEVGAMAAVYLPDEPALSQRTPVFGDGLLSALFPAPATNRASVGFFLDDDFSGFEAFRASMGFSDDGDNVPLSLLGAPAYQAQRRADGGLRTWKEFDDPTLPTCPPNESNVSPGCAILDNGPPSAPGDPTPHVNGVEREVTSIDTFARTQFGKLNGFEWYFASGRPDLDFAYGRDSSGLVAEHLALDPRDEGPLVLTQNAKVDVPVIAIGGSNGLAPEPKVFADDLGAIATPAAWQEVHIIPGYAHLDVVSAEDNEAVPLIADFIRRVRRIPPGHR